ncbi:hypothetical protein BKH42_04270 [Helicobacter sp. 13S00482-2]|uniref:autotransporter outer membrane beta-barrel domain-containing protein n=1 Tax=Helicobacter sp. 13S00482-2 TaxID=1476200 RepID=UPI000BA7389F|nr:autotransporter outer membrane beta-barrel domain-containing protein [Helicobacter sp. 13S00482-2]PAF53720.1 hypothetical protein BKH42_04270 [Helicobacter sp. 13S00482-2]
MTTTHKQTTLFSYVCKNIINIFTRIKNDALAYCLQIFFHRNFAQRIFLIPSVFLIFILMCSNAYGASGTFGDKDGCTAATESCIAGNYTYDDAKNVSVKYTTINGNVVSFKFTGPGSYIDSLEIKGKALSFSAGSSFDVSGIKKGTFTDALLIGDYVNSPGTTQSTLVSEMKFTGNVKKTDEDYAFIGSVKNYNGEVHLDFSVNTDGQGDNSRGANVLGDLIAGAGRDTYGYNKAVFGRFITMKGNIINQANPGESDPSKKGSVIGIYGFSEGSNLIGDISTSVGFMQVLFVDALMQGDINISSDGSYDSHPTINTLPKNLQGQIPEPIDDVVKRDGTTSISFLDGQLTGDINKSNTGKATVSFSYSKAFQPDYAFKGTAKNTGGELVLNFVGDTSGMGDGDDDSSNKIIWKGSEETNIALYNAADTTVNLDKSSVQGDIINTDGGTLNMIFKSSDHGGMFNLMGGGTTINASAGSFLGSFSGSGKLDLTLDVSSAGDIINSNDSSTIKLVASTTETLELGNIDFKGIITGDINNYRTGDINNHNQDGSTFKIINSAVGNITDVKNLDISSSSVGDISNNDSTATLKLHDIVGRTIGNIIFGGTLEADFDNNTVGDITITGGNAKFSLKVTNTIGMINTLGGKNSIVDDTPKGSDPDITIAGTNTSGGEFTFLGKATVSGDILTTGGTSALGFISGGNARGNIITQGGESNVIFFSKVDSSDAHIVGVPIDLSSAHLFSSFTSADAEEKHSMLSSLTFSELSDALRQANISNYGGEIITSGGETGVKFIDSLFLGGSIDTDGGTANVVLELSEAFVSKLKADELMNTLLYQGDGPEFSVNTTSNGTNNIVLQGNVKGVAHFNYLGGDTRIVFADSLNELKDDDSLTDFNDKNSFDMNSADETKRVVKFYGHSYQDGIFVQLDANKANSILSSYRNIFGTNTTTFKVDKISDPSVYSATISGVLVGSVYSLNKSTSSTPKTYEAFFDKNAAFIGDLNITDTNTHITLSQGSKLVLSSDSHITKLSGTQDSAPIDFGNIIGSTLEQRNTVIDLAGISLAQGDLKSSFSTLKIDELSDLGNTMFRLSYDPNVDATDAISKKADHIIISKVNAPTDGSLLSNYIQVFQNSKEFAIGDLSHKNILVLSVANNPTTGKSDILFNNKSSIQQGYDIITTVFEKKEENSSDGDVAPPPIDSSADSSASGSAVIAGAEPSDSEPSADSSDLKPNDSDSKPSDSSSSDSSSSSGDSGDSSDSSSKPSDDADPSKMFAWTNYYIKSAHASIMKGAQNGTQAAISNNYSIFLANINDLNKRLGELRGNTNAQGAWGRIFNGMSTTNRGEEVNIYSTTIQAGYDFSIPHDCARSYFGGALSYGYNVINGTDFNAKAQSIELGAYYSFVSEEGFYTDTILKYSFITDKPSIPKNQSTDEAINSSTVSLGEEFGYRWNFLLKDVQTAKHSLYLEPQAEFILGYIGNGTLNQVNGNSYLNSSIDSILAFRARVGGVVGYALKTARNQTDFRLGLSYVGDVAGGGDIILKTNFSQSKATTTSNHMGMFSVGVNSILSEQWRVYADVDTSFGGKYYNQNYLISVGGRYAFGKTSKVRQTIKTNQPEETNQEQKQNLSGDAKLPSGYYWVVYALQGNSNLNSQQEELLKKYPHRISYEYQNTRNTSGKTNKTAIKYYLLGEFKTKDGALKNQSVADEIAEILNEKKNIKAVLKEIK